MCRDNNINMEYFQIKLFGHVTARHYNILLLSLNLFDESYSLQLYYIIQVLIIR